MKEYLKNYYLGLYKPIYFLQHGDFRIILYSLILTYLSFNLKMRFNFDNNIFLITNISFLGELCFSVFVFLIIAVKNKFKGLFAIITLIFYAQLVLICRPIPLISLILRFASFWFIINQACTLYFIEDNRKNRFILWFFLVVFYFILKWYIGVKVIHNIQQTKLTFWGWIFPMCVMIFECR